MATCVVNMHNEQCYKYVVTKKTLTKHSNHNFLISDDNFRKLGHGSKIYAF